MLWRRVFYPVMRLQACTVRSVRYRWAAWEDGLYAPYKVQLDSNRMVCVPHDHDGSIRAAAPDAAPAPFPELANPEWIASAKEMDEYYTLVELAHLGDLPTARRILIAGARPNDLDVITGLTPLVAAAGNAQLPMLRLLLSYGASVEVISSKDFVESIYT